MSRMYEMRLSVIGYKPNMRERIILAITSEWDFEEDEIKEGETKDPESRCEMSVAGIGCLTCGETEDEFMDRLAQALWFGNDGYCEISVQALYLEDHPSEIHTRDETDYQQWLEEMNRHE